MKIILERAYDDEQHDGARVLVDRIWPRGVKKEALRLDDWAKDAAPSSELRKWFGHEPERWEEFKSRYFRELEQNPDAWRPLLDAERRDDLVLIYGARDRQHNNAVALREFLGAQQTAE
jgi:uncharacterized protein YeaO (DUF488 family)